MSKKKQKEERSKLDETLKGIRKKFGEDSIMMLSETPHVDIDAVSSGSIGIDSVLGIGGFPRGRVAEVYGPESSGKTTLALHVIAQAQARGLNCAFIDAEHAMDPEYAGRIGVDLSKLLISQPSNGEQAMQIVDALVRDGGIGVIVIDSVAALTPRAEIEGEIGEVKIGAQARLMSQSLRVLTGSIAKSKTVVIFLNQVRVNLAAAASWGAPPETTSGGKALKFYASVRLDIRRIATLKNGDEPVGMKSKVKVVKNKVARPFGVAEVDILYSEGISRESELIDLGEKYGVLVRSGNAINFDGEQIGRGHESARRFLVENKGVAAAIESLIRAKMLEK